MPTTNFPEGLTNVAVGHPLAGYVASDPTKWHVYFNDFNTFTPADWTISETQAGATQAVIDGAGGQLALVNSAADNDLNAIQLAFENFRLAAGKKAIFRSRLKVVGSTQSDLVVGLQIRDSAPLDATDGVFFIKPDDQQMITLRVEKNDVASIVAVGSMPENTFVTLAWTFDGVSRFEAFFNDVLVGAVTTAVNWPDDEDLSVSLAVQNGEASAKTLTVDYVFVAVER